MLTQNARARFTAMVLLAGLAGCSKTSEPPLPPKASAPAVAPAVQAGAVAASALGDLAKFRVIAQDVSALVDKGDLMAAKARVKDLELAWDSAEAGLKPRAADDWHQLDKTIDHALKALRTEPPVAADCKATLHALLNTFDTLAGKR